MSNSAAHTPNFLLSVLGKLSDPVISSRIVGEGEMAKLIREFDWEETPLGLIETWSDTLVTTVNLILAAKHPMFLWWGPQLIQFYNDSYRPSMSADKHPNAIGQSGAECWAEIWPIIGPQIEAVMNKGSSTFYTDQLVPIMRDGRLEEVFWTYGYSPVRGKLDAVEGTLVVCTETTDQVLSERRLRTLLAINVDSSISNQLSDSRGFATFARMVVKSLRRNPPDLPFAVLYLLSEGKVLHSESTFPSSELTNPHNWPLRKVMDCQTPLLVDNLQQRFGDTICGPWAEPVTRAYLLPLCIPGSITQGLLVLGISPRLPFDDNYQTFFHLVESRITSLLQGEVLQLEGIQRTSALERQASVLVEKAALLDLTQDAIVVRNMAHQILFWNRGAEAMYGWTSPEALGRDLYELLNSECSESIETIKAFGQWEGEANHRRRDGSRLIVNTRCALQRGADGIPIGILTINSDVTDRKHAESELLSLTDRLSLATAVAKVGVWEWDLASNTVTWDATMFEIYGFQPIVPMPYEKWSGAVHPEDLPSVESILRKVVEEKGRGTAEFRIILADGSIKYISAAERAVSDQLSAAGRVVGVNIDVTERITTENALRKSEVDLRHSAAHDFLTELPNRMLLNDRVTQAIILAPRRQQKVAVLFLDLDGFKHINDSLGHSIGDRLLQSIAKRLVNSIRGSDTVSRLGGDEFIVLLSEVAHPEDIALAAKRLLETVAEAHSIGSHDLHVTASIGVSIYPDDGTDAETLIKNADTAMYQAKENGRQGYQFFAPMMNVRAVARQSIEESLRRALEGKEFEVHYQPKVNLKTGEITGAEALMRWTHPDRGPISPAQFIPVAEDSGLILPIGRWVLREACHQARTWADTGLILSSMAVNISAIEFRNEFFLEEVFQVLKDTGLDPNILELELTESVLMKHVEATEEILKELRGIGVHLAVDDFGTGYSSLSYLSKLPIDVLKIDQSFVRQITTSPDDTTIVTAIIGIGKSLNLRVVAEGVETQDELAFLRAHECDEGQGFYFSRPVRSEQFARLLEKDMSDRAVL